MCVSFFHTHFFFPVSRRAFEYRVGMAPLEALGRRVEFSRLVLWRKQNAEQAVEVFNTYLSWFVRLKDTFQ